MSFFVVANLGDAAVSGPIVDGAVLANTNGSTATPVATGLSTLLDHVFGSTQGMLLTRSASAWGGTTSPTLPALAVTGAAAVGSLNAGAASVSSLAASGGVTTPSLGMTVTLTPTSGLNVQAVTQQLTLNGSINYPYFANIHQILGDTLAVTGNQFVTGWTFTHAFGGSAVQGGRVAIDPVLTLTAPTNSANANRNYVAANLGVIAQSGDGGTDTGAGAKGAFFATNPYYNIGAAATFIQEATGGEVNSFTATGCSIRYKNLWSLVAGGALDQVQGTVFDTMLALSAQPGSVGFQNGILIGDMNGQFPLTSSGTLLKTLSTSTIDTGIDISSVFITNYTFRSRLVNFYQNGASFGGAGTNGNGFITMLSNTAGIMPPSATTTFALSDHFSAARDVDLWNCDTAAAVSFEFLQKTGASTATQVFAIGPTGVLSVTAGAIPATPPAGSVSLYVDQADGKLKSKGPAGTVTVLSS